MASKKRVAKRRPAGKILPKKMSKLIEIALKDLRKVEATKGMVVDMSTWFNPDDEVVCMVGDIELKREPICTACLAGSVMAFTLGKKGSTRELTPVDMRGNEAQLDAINELREGNVARAAEILGLISENTKWDSFRGAYVPNEEYEEIHAEFDREMEEYDHTDPKPFHKDMEKLMKQLIKAGY